MAVDSAFDRETLLFALADRVGASLTPPFSWPNISLFLWSFQKWIGTLLTYFQYDNLNIPTLLFQDLYRALLEAESEGILDDVNMTEVERLILDSGPETA